MTPDHASPTTSRPSGDSRTAVGKRAVPWALVVLAAVVGLDQLTKWLVVENLRPATPYPVIGDVARLYLIRNPGAAFSMGEEATPFFAVIQLAAALLCIYLAFRTTSPWAFTAVGLIGGGAAGNFIDRVFRDPGGLHGHVVDFISVGDFAIFNIADSGITVGVVVYLFYALFIEPRQSRDSAGDSARDIAGDRNGEVR
ncbi:signal peptidase II [Corynebacterium provencense]|uniref:Lipoprotein signal peptidase n=1 Tax=Corynebacterium provencense TaxID=1737425 RepID=A0A2Z3YPE5_9CORY|nr:signal peptidase II [Corynebacterium provencense]AWT26416.1 Lipoprotein signal peptidase [Corynebacterium provencense]